MSLEKTKQPWNEPFRSKSEGMGTREMEDSECYLRFWGVRGSYAAPYPSHLQVGGNTSCVELRFGKYLLLCDAGSGIIPLGKALMHKEPSQQELFILLTHYHWDHICGMPFFLPAFSPEWRLKIFGPGQDSLEVEEYVSSQMTSPFFPVSTATWLADIKYLAPASKEFTHGPFKISYRNVHHPGITFGYRIEVAGRSIVYISDNECLYLEKTISQKSSQFNAAERRYYDEMQEEGHKAELELFEKADVLIHDAQYTRDEYEKKQGWGHSYYLDAVQSALDANVKLLFLFHHDPSHNDEQMQEIHYHALELINSCQSPMKCLVAREGLKLHLGGAKKNGPRQDRQAREKIPEKSPEKSTQ